MFGLALAVGCGSTSGDVDELAAATTDAPTTAAGSTSSADASTGEGLGSTGLEASSSSSAGETGVPFEPPPVECDTSDCGVSCARPEHQTPEYCQCEAEQEPEGYVACELPMPCQGSLWHSTCLTQGIRYNIPGAYEQQLNEVDDYEILRYEVFGPGRVRASWWAQYHGCCGYGASSHSSYRFPQATLPADDPHWDECQGGPGGSCTRMHLVLPELACQPMLEVCPELTPLGETCEESCPMAGDGVCDEEMGTGLCADGCDPLDCPAD